MSETLLFPVGPLEIDAEQVFGLLIVTPRDPVRPVWSTSFEDALAKAEALVDGEDWITVNWLADTCPSARGHGRKLRLDHAIFLSRTLGDLYDPDGFGSLQSDMNAFALMRAMGEFLEASRQMADGRSQPVMLSITDENSSQTFAAALGRDGQGAYIYLTYSEEMLVKLIETSFGQPLPDWVGFTMVRVDADDGWIGKATHGLFGTSFRPMIRHRTTQGVTRAVPESSMRPLISAVFRAADIAEGAPSATGRIALHDWAAEVEMWRFDP